MTLPTTKIEMLTFRTVSMADAVPEREETQIPLDEQLKEIGTQLDWVRGYL